MWDCGIIQNKWLIFLTGVFISSHVCAQQDTIQQLYNVRYFNSGADTLPHFGNDEEDLWKYIADHFRYNHQLYDETGEGWRKIICNLAIDTTGTVNFYSIENNAPGRNINVDNLTEKEFRRIFDSMPQWRPAIKNNQAIPYSLAIAMEYRLTPAGIEIKNGGVQATRGQSANPSVHQAKKIITIAAIVIMGWFLIQMFSRKL